LYFSVTVTITINLFDIFQLQLQLIDFSVGDFNAQIGPDTTGFENVIGKQALGQRTAVKHTV